MSGTTIVELHQLQVGDRTDDGYEIGRPETGVFVSLPDEGMALLAWMQEGLSLDEIGRRFTERYGQQPALEEFLDAIENLGFIRRVDGVSIGDGGDLDGGRGGWRLLSSLPQHRVAWLASMPMRTIYVAIWLLTPMLLVLHPDVVPSPAEASLHSRVMVNALGLALLGWVLVFLHEVAHVLAARAVGCASSLSLGHRLHFLVAQTDLTAVRTLPRARRYGPYVAGLTWDVGLLLACSLTRAAGVDTPLLNAVAYLTIMGILFQFAFFMRTDIYFVFVNWLRLGNLMEDTRHWLANVLHALARRPGPHDLNGVPPRELRIVRWYSVFCLVGVAVVLAQLIVFGIPLLSVLFEQAGEGLAQGPVAGAFWESAAFVALTVSNLVVLGYLAWRERHARRASALRAGHQGLEIELP